MYRYRLCMRILYNFSNYIPSQPHTHSSIRTQKEHITHTHYTKKRETADRAICFVIHTRVDIDENTSAKPLYEQKSPIKGPPEARIDSHYIHVR